MVWMLEWVVDGKVFVQFFGNTEALATKAACLPVPARVAEVTVLGDTDVRRLERIARDAREALIADAKAFDQWVESEFAGYTGEASDTRPRLKPSAHVDQCGCDACWQKHVVDGGQVAPTQIT